jgi:succinate dehydrogenase / fumarate reductase, cytochrome b subunit
MAAPSKPSPVKKSAGARAGGQKTARTVPRKPFLLEFYGSATGKKFTMAVTGAFFMFYVLLHMVGNLKLYIGPTYMDEYAEWLGAFGAPALPETGFLWVMRVLLLGSFILHIHSAYALTRINQKARTNKYEQKRDYIAADFASRTMRWTGIIVGLFVVYHILHFTTGTVHPDFQYGAVYSNVVIGFENPLVAGFYILANLALGLHLYHGGYSLFRSLGASNPRFDPWRRYFAIGFAAIIVIGNVSFPIAVLAGIVS